MVTPKLEIQDLLDQPDALEALYRKEPGAFEAALVALPAPSSTHLVAQAWQARLAANLDGASERDSRVSSEPAIRWGQIALWALAAGLMCRGLESIGNDVMLRNAAFAVIVPLAFVLRQSQHRDLRVDLAIAVALFFAWIVSQTVPIETSDSGALALIHTPMLLWCGMGAWTAGAAWRDTRTRIDYVLRTGEILVFTAAILLGGILLTFLTIAMFHVIHVNIQEWYTSNVVVVGMAAAPIVAAGLTRAREARGEAIAPQLARIFSPLALTTLAAYAATIVWTGRSPHEDRDALIVLNCMLAGAAALVALSTLAPQTSRNRSEWGLAALQASIAWIAVCVDVFALFAIAYRTAEGGWTPNRVAVLGENLLLLVFLAGVALNLSAIVTERANRQSLSRFVSVILPAFAAWTAFVVFALPLLFRFE